MRFARCIFGLIILLHLFIIFILAADTVHCIQCCIERCKDRTGDNMWLDPTMDWMCDIILSCGQMLSGNDRKCTWLFGWPLVSSLRSILFCTQLCIYHVPVTKFPTDPTCTAFLFPRRCTSHLPRLHSVLPDRPQTGSDELASCQWLDSFDLWHPLTDLWLYELSHYLHISWLYII